MSAHTPGPWGASGDRVYTDDGMQRICECEHEGFNGSGEIIGLPADANAAFIVRACNAHSDLVAALKAAIERCKFLGERISSNFQVPISSEHTDELESWRAVLAEAQP